ncbi:atrial natriuretic peptide receptor 3-like [Amphiura filiformis]|uniref:atrial natriuretic peptide receptor 3-like n=1 Tax=Amphiura filiformis TaxID=82378 RepID=UPI003B220C33
MYADDTIIYYASNSTKEIMNCINEDLNIISNWLKSNKLSLNTDKSEFMLIGSRQRLQSVKDDIHNVSVTINGANIKQVNECKHLGVIIDDTLTWNQQIGQVRKKSLKGLSDLARYWNIPIISGASTSSDLANKDRHTHFTRLSYDVTGMAHLISETFRRFNWTRCSHVRGSGYLSGIPADAVDDKLQDDYVRMYQYRTRDFDNVTDAIRKAGEVSRVIILSAKGNEVREAMAAAYDLGFINGEYAFLAFHPFNNSWQFGNYEWKQNDGLDEKVRKAYDALLHIRLYEPSTPEYAEFERKIAERQLELYNWTRPEGDNTNYFAGAFHDALILYANVVNQTLAENGSVRDGAAMVKKMWNSTFEGIGGTVAIKANGDRDADYSLYDFREENFEVVASYYGATGQIVIEGDIHWPGGADGPPPDTPFCGYENENPLCRQQGR